MALSDGHGAKKNPLYRRHPPRPNFMEIAPILRSLCEHVPQIEAKLIHMGQHYDHAMNQAFFEQLEIPRPDISLEVGSCSHVVQTAEIIKRFEPVLDDEQPDCVLVVSDVNSTMACAVGSLPRRR